jgi:hypothetical protein
MLTLGEPVRVASHDDPRPVSTAGADPYAEPPARPPTSAADDSGWRLDDEEPAVLERSAPPAASTAATESLPTCPACQGQMWDNRPKKASGEYSPKAPDFKCRDRECDGKLWPGQWPPKAKQEELGV